MPLPTLIFIGPVAAAIFFFTAVLIKPKSPVKNYARFIARTATSLCLIIIATAAYTATAQEQANTSSSQELRYNSQLKAVTSSLLNDSLWQWRNPSIWNRRIIPSMEQSQFLAPSANSSHLNIVIIILEGIQYHQTSLDNASGLPSQDKTANLTPYLQKLASEGVEFTNTASSFTHTTKALFALLSGRHPSPSQDITETIPVNKPFVSLASILHSQLQYRTAYFQSSKGEFKSAPALFTISVSMPFGQENVSAAPMNLSATRTATILRCSVL